MPINKTTLSAGRQILHIDFDSYFASCEQQFNPKLRGKPIGVTAQNGRTCIIAASREAKKLGVKSPSRTWEAQKLIPYMVFVPAQFERYWEITRKFLNICKDYSPFVELFSLDEVFMDITLTSHLYNGPYGISKIIRERIKDEIGEYVTVSVGISHNKLLAKLGSGLNKPNGLTEITKNNVWDIYSKIKLTDLCGIGERIEKRLNGIGIYTAIDLRNAPLEILLKEFKDVEGHFLKNLGMAHDDSEVIPYYFETETKSVGRSYCLPQNEYDKRLVLQNVYELCEEVTLKLRRLNKKARTAGIYLGGDKNIHGRKTARSYFETGQELFNLCMVILKENNFYFGENSYVRRIGIWVSGIENSANITLSLFEEDSRKNNLWKTVDKINDKFGDHTIRNAFLLYADKLTTVPNGYMADKYERTKLSLSNV